MAPKQITRLAIIVAAISLVGIVGMVILQPAWGGWTWWPAMGLGVAALLLVVSYLRGAYLTAQRRAELVDLLNDCYTGNTERG